jgi:cystathionine beta-lyase
MLNFDNIIDRKGTFCTQWDFVQDRFGVADLLPFTISDTDFALPQEAIEVLTQRLKHPVFGYTRWNHAAFKNSVCRWYQNRFDTPFNEEWLMYSPSVIYSISKLIQLVSKEHEGVVVQTPAYDAFFKVIEGNNRQVVENPLCYQENRYTIDFQNLEEKLAKKNNTILLLCSPHNPTGRVWSTQELRKIVALCEQYQVFLISDEIHMDVLRKGVTHQPIFNFSNKKIALVSSGSKTFNFPGLVFSYAILPDVQVRAQFQLALKNQDGLSSASTLGMLATMTAIKQLFR